MKCLPALAAIAAILAPGLASAQAYPTKPITVIVPHAPGATDPYARVLAPALSEILGQPVLVEARGGAGGAIGINAVKNSDPDGYTLLFVAQPALMMPPMVRNVGYSFEDFRPLGMISTIPTVLGASTDVPYSDLAGLIEYAKANPDEVRIAHGGVGTQTHLNAEVLEQLGGVDLFQVPYQGVGPGILGILQGEADMIFAYASLFSPHIATGKMRILAASSEERFSYLPDTPTFAEAGIGLFDNARLGFYAPAATDPAIIATLEAAIAKAYESKDFITFMETTQSGREYLSPQQVGEILDGYTQYMDDFFKSNPALFNLLASQ